MTLYSTAVARLIDEDPSMAYVLAARCLERERSEAGSPPMPVIVPDANR